MLINIDGILAISTLVARKECPKTYNEYIH